MLSTEDPKAAGVPIHCLYSFHIYSWELKAQQGTRVWTALYLQTKADLEFIKEASKER